MTKSLEEKWKKNDALMKAALKKMRIKFKRNTTTWEAHAYIGRAFAGNEICCYDKDDNFIDEGPNTPESLGEIKYFFDLYKYEPINNIFFGVKNFAELQIKLDLIENATPKGIHLQWMPRDVAKTRVNRL